MATNVRQMQGVSAASVWEALLDGFTYGHWVVGTRGVRAVTPGWPDAGSEIHYTVGRLPFRKDDKTVAVSYDPNRRLELEALVRPLGSLSIVLRVEPGAEGTTVVIEEAPKTGLLKTLHNPGVDLAIKARNVETLRRLEQQARIKQGQAASG